MNSATLTLSRPGTRLIATILASGLLVATLAGVASAPTRAQEGADETLRTLSVSGTGRVNAVPDVADISLGVFETAKEAAAASQQAAASMDAVVQALLSLGIDEKDIQTTSISLDARYDWNQEPAQIVGWDARNMVNVTVRDVEAVGDVVDAVVEAGSNQINGISFRVEDPTEAQAIARTAAVEDARAKAEQLAADAGVEIVGIISISETSGQPPQPIYMARQEMAFADTAAAATPVLPGEVELSVNVSIQYEIA